MAGKNGDYVLRVVMLIGGLFGFFIVGAILAEGIGGFFADEIVHHRRGRPIPVQIGNIVGFVIGIIAAYFAVPEEYKKSEPEKEESETKAANANAASPSDREPPTVVPEGTIVQAKCGNCASKLSCEKFKDDSYCCGEHEYFRG